MIPDSVVPEPNKLSIEDLTEYDDVVRHVLRKVVTFQLFAPSFESLNNCFFNKDTLPGFHYQFCGGFKSKKEAAFSALEIAKEKWKTIEECARNSSKLVREKLFPSTYTIGARNKRDFSKEDNDVMTSRAVHMPEFHDEICCTPWLEPITTEIMNRKKGPVYIGNSYVRYERLVKDSEDGKTILEGDWKRFDSTLYLHMILMGVSILRCFYPNNSKRADYHFISIFDSLSIKDYYTPGGYIYRLYHGIPSGVKCTNLLGSIINLLALITCCKKFSPKKMNFIVGGDDHLIIFKNDVLSDDDIEEIKENASSIGMNFKFLLRKNFSAERSDERPIFYKYTIDRNEPIIPASSMLERVFIPWNKNYTDNFQFFDFLKDVLPSLGSPRSTNLLYYALYKSVYQRIFGMEISLGNIFKMHKSIYNFCMREKFDYKEEKKRFLLSISLKDSKSTFFIKNFNKFK